MTNNSISHFSKMQWSGMGSGNGKVSLNVRLELPLKSLFPSYHTDTEKSLGKNLNRRDHLKKFGI